MRITFAYTEQTRTPSFAAHFLWTQLQPLPALTADFTGKTAIVTGANVGLGLEAARHMIRLGATKVILGCRSTEKGEVAKRDIEGTTGADPGAVEVWPLDLGSYESVREFCRRAEGFERLDVLLANAAMSILDFSLQEGYESTITVNVLSTFLMVYLLLPKLKQTATRFNTVPHVSIVSSDAHYFVRLLRGFTWVLPVFFVRHRAVYQCVLFF